MGRERGVDRISVSETLLAEVGRERREWSRSAFSCSLTNRSPVLRTSHRSRLPAPEKGKREDDEDDGDTTKDSRIFHPHPYLPLGRSYPSPLAPPPSTPRGYPQKNFANGFETLQVCSHLGYPSQFAMVAREASEHSFRRTLARSAGKKKQYTCELRDCELWIQKIAVKTSRKCRVKSERFLFKSRAIKAASRKLIHVI